MAVDNGKVYLFSLTKTDLGRKDRQMQKFILMRGSKEQQFRGIHAL